MKKHIFLTGGSGFVGSNLIPFLAHSGHQVQALARSSNSLEKVRQYGAQAVQGDLFEPHSYQPALQNTDIVIHAAAHLDFSYDKELFVALNVEATDHLLASAKAAGVKQFIYIGAASVISGQEVRGKDESYVPAQEPSDYYSQTKLAAEKLVLAANTPDFQCIVLRPPAIWGPNNHSAQEIIEMARQGKWRWIGKGEHCLSTIHVQNLNAAIVAAMEKGRGGEVYFVTDGQKRSVKESFGGIIQAHGIEPGDKSVPRGLALALAKCIGFFYQLFKIKSRPPIAPVMIYLMGTEFTVSDAKARRELGYQNAISVEEGLEELRQLAAGKVS